MFMEKGDLGKHCLLLHKTGFPDDVTYLHDMPILGTFSRFCYLRRPHNYVLLQVDMHK